MARARVKRERLTRGLRIEEFQADMTGCLRFIELRRPFSAKLGCRVPRPDTCCSSENICRSSGKVSRVSTATRLVVYLAFNPRAREKIAGTKGTKRRIYYPMLRHEGASSTTSKR